MYRVNVLTDGKHHNVATGSRYCFTRKAAKDLAKLFVDCECDVLIHKLIRIKVSPWLFFWQDSYWWSDHYECVGFDVEELAGDDN